MERIIKFNTTAGPMWIDLEEVAMVTHGKTGFEGKPCIVLKCGQNWTLNESFKADIERFMDAWMAHKNGQV